MIDVPLQIGLLEPNLAREEDAGECDGGFADLVNRQSRFVFRVAYSILRNVPDTEDVVQETFLKLYRSHAWDRMDDEKAFLARMAWRLAINHLQKARKTAPGFAVPPSGENPEDAVISADWKGAINRLIDALPEELRQPLALSTVEEMNSREIAAVMGIPEGTVRTRLMRARQVLKQKVTALMAGPYGK